MSEGIVLGEVRRWVDRHPEGDLWVCTGFLSAWGLAQLAEMAPRRPVLVLTSKAWHSVSDRATDADRRAAIAFLNRPDVRVQLWWRQARNGMPKRDQHIKAFIANPNGRAPAALTGSANLTRAGLEGNQEVMVGVSPSDTHKLLNQVREMLRGNTDQKQAVIDRIRGTKSGGQRPPRKAATNAHRARRGSAEPSAKSRRSATTPPKPSGTYRWSSKQTSKPSAARADEPERSQFADQFRSGVRDAAKQAGKMGGKAKRALRRRRRR